MCGVVNSAVGFVDVVCVVNVHECGKRHSNDLSCTHWPLQGLAFQNGPNPNPGSDAAAQNALKCPHVERVQDGGRETGFLHPSQKVELLQIYMEGPSMFSRESTTISFFVSLFVLE